MKRMIALCCSCVISHLVVIGSDPFVWNGRAGDNDWTNGSNYDGGNPPAAGDVVAIPDGVTATVSSVNSDSWAKASSLDRIAPMGNGSRIVIHVEDGKSLDFAAGITREADWNSQIGIVEKTGAGTLYLIKAQSVYDYFVNEFVVSEGVVDCSKRGMAQYLKTLNMAEGATYITPKQTFWVAGVSGDGVLKTTTGWDTRVYGGTLDNPALIAAKFGEGVVYSGAGHTRFLRNDNLMSSFAVYSGVTEVFGIGMVNTASGTGKNWTLGFTSVGIGTIRYIGNADTLTDKNMSIANELDTSPGIGTFDAGPHGGITFNGDWTWKTGTWGRSHILSQYWLIGSNTVPCVINGKIGFPASSKSGTLGVVKKGAGAWQLLNSENFFDSTIDIQQGELGFGSIKEKGELCALGTATDLKAPDCHGDYASAPDFPYAFRLGCSLLSYPNGDLATLRCLSTVKSSCTTRPIALAGDGRIVSDSQKLVFRGASSVVEGVNHLVLAGDNVGITNVFHDITDGVSGMRTGIVKDGAGTWILTGTNTWTGPLVVNGGKLIMKRPSDIYTWYRLVIKDSCRIDWPGNGFDCYKIGRIGLFDKDGYRQNIGLEFISELPQNSGVLADDHIPSLLEAGQFGWGMPKRYDWGSDMHLSLAHVCSTGGASDNSCLFLIRESVRSHYIDDPDKYVYIDMRLPAGSPEIEYYDIAAIYNKGNYLELYNIKSWTLLGSTDGITWDELHSISDVMSEDPTQKMKLPSTAVSWMAQNVTTEGNTATTIHNTEKLQKINSRRSGAPIPFFETGLPAVTVANGAVLEADGEMTLSKFRVNYGSTPGTIKGFTLARRCEIDVSDLPDGIQGFDVPLVFDGTSADCTEWTVMVNGRLSNRFKAVMTNGHLRLYRNALVYIVK